MFNALTNGTDNFFKKYILNFRSKLSHKKIQTTNVLNYTDIIPKNNTKLICCSDKKLEDSQLNSKIIDSINRENKLIERYFKLHTNDLTFIRENICIDLYVDLKFISSSSRQKQTITLCKYAIMALIEPSEKVSVCYHDNLEKLIEEKLRKDWKLHFVGNFDFKDTVALLILSPCAGLLIKHNNATLIHTMRHILQCSPSKIVVLVPRG